MPISEHDFDDEELDIDYSEIERQFEPTLDEGFEHVLVIDNLPIVDSEKKAKLLEKLCSQFKKLGVNAQPEQLILPWDESAAASKGFAFYVLPNATDAAFALRVLDQTKFGKNLLHFNRFSDVERFANVEPEWSEPQEETFTAKAHLKKWLADPQGRDQYLTLQGTTASVYWNGRQGQTEEIPYKDARWGDYFLAWSPQGTYLASTHAPGVALWGGERFQSLCRFSHPHLALIDFSPCENYLVTCSTADHPITVAEGAPSGPSQFVAGEDDGNHIAVWDIKSGRLLRTFPGDFTPADGSKEPSRVPRWPALKWSPDDQFVGRLTTGSQLSIYAAPSMELVDKKSIKLAGVQDFAWCPLGEKDKAPAAAGKKKEERENCFAFWLPEIDNQPARVTLMGFPSRNILRSKNLFNVSDCKLHWHDQGDYLCVKVDRHTKTKKSTFCNLEIFRMREKNYPVEVIELKDAVTAFAWEPKGDRFGFIACSDPNPGPGVTIKYNVAFYQIDPKKGDFKQLTLIENKPINRIFWSPRGRQVVLAAFESSQKCDIEFYDVDFTTDDKKTEGGVWGANVKFLSASEHYGMTDLSWDPSGRYIATHATSWRPGTDSGYALWDFKGTQLKMDNVDSFKQFLWRPRPASVLPKDEQKKIRKNLREYARQFDEEDAAAESQGSAEVLQLRRRLVDEWNAWHSAARKTLLEERHASGIWPAKEDKKAEDQQAEEIEEIVEEVIDEREEIVG